MIKANIETEIAPIVGTEQQAKDLIQYIDEHVVSNDDLAKLVDTSDEWIASRTGIRNRRIATKESGLLDTLSSVSAECSEYGN